MNKSHKNIILFSISLIVLCLILLTVLILLQESDKIDYIYREISYTKISDDINKNSKNEKEIILNTFEYIRNNVFVPNAGRVRDVNPFDILFRGIGWCDQQANLLAVLLDKQNIRARWISLCYLDNLSSHSISEILFNKQWVIVDPLYGLTLQKIDTSFSTREEICRDKTIVTKNLKVLADLKYQNISYNSYAELFCNKPCLRWGTPRESKDFKRRVIERIIKIFARKSNQLTFLFQDIYLIQKMESFKTEDYKIFFKARNYHLYNRLTLATKNYEQLIEKYPKSEYYEHSLFFLGKLYCENNSPLSGINVLNKIIKTVPCPIWEEIVYYQLGSCYEEVYDFKKAEEYYLKSLQKSEGRLLDSSLKIERFKNE